MRSSAAVGGTVLSDQGKVVLRMDALPGMELAGKLKNTTP